MRMRLGKSQAELAATLGCQRNTVTRWEMDLVKPSPVMLMLLSDLAVEEERSPLTEELAGHVGALMQLTRGAVQRQLTAVAAWLDNPQNAALVQKFFEESPPNERRQKQAENPIGEILSLWAQYGANRNALKYFRDAAAFLRVQLAGMDGKAMPERAIVPPVARLKKRRG